MKLARVLGSVTQTIHHPAYDGQKLLVVRPIDERGVDAGNTFLAVDSVQAGPGDRVLVLQEGNGIRQILAEPHLPIQCLIVGIVDDIDGDRRE